MFVLMIVGVCCKIAWWMDWVMMVGMSESGMLVAHLVYLLARRSKPYVAVLKIGRIWCRSFGRC